MVKLVEATRLLPGVKIKLQLANGAMFWQFESSTVTLLCKAVPVMLAVTLVAASSEEVLVTVIKPGWPFCTRCNGEWEIFRIAVVTGGAKVIASCLAGVGW